MDLGPDVASPPPSWGGMEPGGSGGRPRRWQWAARNPAGELKRGEAMELTSEDVVARLEQVGYSEIRVRRVYYSGLPGLRRLWASIGLVMRVDREVTSRQLGTMVGAGLPLVQCLEILMVHCENRRVGRELENVKGAVSSGVPLAEAFRAQSLFQGAFELEGVSLGQLPAALHAFATRMGRR